MSFGGVIEASCGRRGALASQVAVILNNMGELVVFLVIIGDVLVGPADDKGVINPAWFADGEKSVFVQKWFAIGLMVLFVHTPLCLLRRVESLSFTSTLSMGLSALFVCITFSLVLYRLGRGQISGVEFVPMEHTTKTELLASLPVLMILYVCHYNVHPIFAGMRRPTEKRMRRVVRTSLLFTTGVYWLIGLSAYLLFTDKTQGNVLINYGKDLQLNSSLASGILEHVVKIGYAIAISFTFPLIQVAVKENVFDLLGWGEMDKVSGPRYYGATLTLLAIEYAIAIVVPDISIAFAILGSTVAILIAFILPALVGMYGSDMVNWGKGLLAGGSFIGVSCLSATIYVLSMGGSVHR
jgi:solute carrier family 38 (sodium-coupled neutral amino acid transporter), member 2